MKRRALIVSIVTVFLAAKHSWFDASWESRV
jgi:hypothetical protein